MISNSNFELECYRYKSIQSFTNNNIDGQRENYAKNETANKLAPEWISNLGE